MRNILPWSDPGPAKMEGPVLCHAWDTQSNLSAHFVSCFSKDKWLWTVTRNVQCNTLWGRHIKQVRCDSKDMSLVNFQESMLMAEKRVLTILQTYTDPRWGQADFYQPAHWCMGLDWFVLVSFFTFSPSRNLSYLLVRVSIFLLSARRETILFVKKVENFRNIGPITERKHGETTEFVSYNAIPHDNSNRFPGAQANKNLACFNNLSDDRPIHFKMAPFPA